MMVICVKQRLSNIWSSVQEKVKKLRLSRKKALYIKKARSLQHTYLFEILFFNSLRLFFISLSSDFVWGIAKKLYLGVFLRINSF